jgi:hypothetical protein
VEPQQTIPIIEDLRFVYPTIIPWGMISAVVVGALVSIAAVTLLALRWHKRHAIVRALTRPQREALRSLRTAFREWRETGYLVFLHHVTRILRRYLEQRFGIHAPMQTTRELTLAAESIPQLAGPQREALHGLLDRCDLITFASALTMERELEGLYQSACNFVKSTAWRKDVEGVVLKEHPEDEDLRTRARTETEAGAAFIEAIQDLSDDEDGNDIRQTENV